MQPGEKVGGGGLASANVEPRATEIRQLPHLPKGYFHLHKAMKGPQLSIIPIHSTGWNLIHHGSSGTMH